MSQKLIRVRDLENPKAYWEIDFRENTRTMKDENGTLVTMDLGQQDVHIDSALANYAARYRQWEGIADSVAPVIPVGFASNKYYTWGVDDVFQNVEDLIVGPNSEPGEVGGTLATATYSTVAYGLQTAIPTELEANADSPLKIQIAYTQRILDAIALGREVRTAALVSTSGNWTGGYTTTLGATAKWNGGSTSNPIQDLYTAIENSLTPVRAIAMSEQVWHDFVQNAAVQKYIAAKTDLPPLPNVQAGDYNLISSQFSALLGLPPFLIGRMRKKTANTPTYGYVWGNNVALLYTEPSIPMMTTPSTAKTFRWTGADSAVPDGTLQGGFLVRSYFDPKRGARGSRIVVVTHNDAEVMTSVVAGGLIINAHQ
jgi:hypothetical protein